MIEGYQEERALSAPEPLEAAFATIGGIFSDGVTLIFDGQTTASAKHYKTNAFIKFSVGDRVKLIKDSGTYVVEYPVGAPKISFSADSASASDKSNAVQDQYYSSKAIQFKTDSSGNLYFRTGSTWTKLSNA